MTDNTFAGVVVRVVVEPGRDIESLRGMDCPIGYVLKNAFLPF